MEKTKKRRKTKSKGRIKEKRKEMRNNGTFFRFLHKKKRKNKDSIDASRNKYIRNSLRLKAISFLFIQNYIELFPRHFCCNVYKINRKRNGRIEV